MKTLLSCLLLTWGALASHAQVTVATVRLSYGAVLTMRQARFRAAQHRLGYQPADIVNTIDGQAFFGTDGEVPRSQLVGASVLINGTHYQLPVGRMYDPWPWSYEPAPRLFRLIRTRRPQGYLLWGMFSDGAGAYAAKWLLSGGTAKRIVLSNDEQYVF